MKQNINEIRRMQQLAGIIKEYGELSRKDRLIGEVEYYLIRHINEVLGTKDYDLEGDCLSPKYYSITERFTSPEAIEKYTYIDHVDRPVVISGDLNNAIKAAVQEANFEECLGTDDVFDNLGTDDIFDN